MLDIFHFIFSSFWIWVGFAILLYIIGECIVQIITAVVESISDIIKALKE